MNTPPVCFTGELADNSYRPEVIYARLPIADVSGWRLGDAVEVRDSSDLAQGRVTVVNISGQLPS